MARAQPITGKKRNIKPEKARKLINRFHALNKERALCAARGDTKKCASIDAELAKLGGLDTYQMASICGQSGTRGGDSSKVLMEWIPKSFKGSMLEVGCLKIDNFCARSKQFSPHVRIDLHSQHPEIKEQDFLKMKMPDPKFDIISLSLVINYAPTSAERGEMLVRAHQFLKPNGLVFLVLPRACIDNSRYVNEDVMETLFRGVGFKAEQVKRSARLVYWLLRKQQGEPNFSLPKRQIKNGAGMNNFAISVSSDAGRSGH